MPDVDHDVETRSAVNGDRVVHRCVQRRNQRGEPVSVLTGTETHARAVSLWRDLGHEDVDPEIHPETFEGLLYRRHDARLPRSGRAIQDPDLTGFGWLVHLDPLSSRPRSDTPSRRRRSAGRGTLEIGHKPFERSDRGLEPRHIHLVECRQRPTDASDTLTAATQDEGLAVGRRLHTYDPAVFPVTDASSEALCFENADGLRHRRCAHLLGPRELPDRHPAREDNGG